MRASLRTIPLAADPFPSDSVITLDQIRPGPRRTNDYVDSPRAAATPPIKPHLAPQSHHALVEGGGGVSSPLLVHGRLLPPVRTGSVTGSRVGGGGGGNEGGSPRPVLSPSSVVSHQPLKKNGVDSLEDRGVIHRDTADSRLNGDASAAAGTNHHQAGVGGGGGIICDKCHKCQCNDCTESKPLFSHWCCGNSCEVSPEKVVDGCTCFCCVKTIMYHFGNEEDYENPCGCCCSSASRSSHCLRRWTLMTAMSLCLPCLCAYWPARGCLAACNTVYNRCWHRKGCKCQCNIVKPDSDTKSSVLSRGSGVGSGGTSGGGGGGTSKNSQSRRLLIESDSSSST